MSAFSPARRKSVIERAGHRCEYCHLPTRGQVATFPIDHVDPKANDGASELENLALACPHCNAHKWTSCEANDPVSGALIRLYHPRRDVWEDHFEWREGAFDLAGKTPIGRATIQALRINDTDMVELRALLSELGLFAASAR